MDIMNIVWAVVWFAVLGVVLGIVLAIASKIFEVKVDPRIEEISDCLPGANCGGCGFSGCAALAQAIVEGKASPAACNAAEDEAVEKISGIMGISNEGRVRMRAQVMCSGTNEHAMKKYVYEGENNCISAARLGGGDKLCPFGCIGLGSCVSACKFDAISIIDGVAAVDYHKCTGCGACVVTCPKGTIKLIPYDSRHWVGCEAADKGGAVRKYCDVGCIGCKLCEKACEAGAIMVDNNIASIDYSKCTGCDKCVDACPRKIIWSSDSQGDSLIIKRV